MYRFLGKFELTESIFMPQERNKKRFRLILLPFSILYGLVIRIRHKLFDWNILSSKSFNFPIICVGNLTIGGTGKTPHIEYLVELLKDNFKVSVLSRGYKRKTKGFVLANKKSTPETIGDEPFQIHRKYQDITVAVCEKRVEGINNLINRKNKPNTILLDDAFQHRYVKPGVNILLIDYNRPTFNDKLIPAGNLRDTIKQMKRADLVIVSKTPQNITGIEKRLWIKQLNLYPYQKLFFTSIEYGKPTPVFPDKTNKSSLNELKNEYKEILLVTGIANPKPLEDYLKTLGLKVGSMNFPDHHNFTKTDLNNIKEKLDSIESKKKIILTTEKDAVRFKHQKDFPKSLKNKMFYIPIKLTFMDKGKTDFDKIIINYVRTNKRIGKIHS